jgi:hypothetical protein
MSDDKPNAILGTTATVRTMADGGMKITIDISPPDMKRAFELFGMSGTNVAIARVTQVVAQSHAQRAAIKDLAAGANGKAYQCLYRLGWFNNPNIRPALGMDKSASLDDVKEHLYRQLGVSSLADVSPDSFRALLDEYGIAGTLPREFGA